MYEKIDKSIYTPMMQQYLSIKENYPDTLLFYRIGDFYEMFFNDAIVASKELEIVLTGRDAGVKERVPMCGVPFHAVNVYIEKLSQKGYKVAIVEQLEQPDGKKLVKRDVIKIVTPGTNVDEAYLNDKSFNYLASIEETKDYYILAYVELSTGEALVTKLPNNDNILISEIVKLNIKEVLVSSSFNKNIINTLNKVYGIVISVNDELTLDDYMTNLTSNIDSQLESSCKRLLNYVVTTQKRVLVHISSFKYVPTNSYLRLDNACIKNLELIEGASGNRFKNNLFQVLDKCQTAMGSRFLKKSIMFPLIDYKEINERLDLIDLLNKHYLDSMYLKDYLSNIYDLERIIGRISFNTLNPKDLIQLRKSLSVLPKIKKILINLNTKVALDLANRLETFDDLYLELSNAIMDSPSLSIKDGGVIKEGYSKDLDDIRNIALSNKEFLTNLEQRERERTKIKALKVGYNRVFGYYIEITKSYLHLVKEEFGYIRKQTTSNSERYITQELKERETLILRSNETIKELELSLFNKVKDQCKSVTSSLKSCANIISYLDMMLSLSTVSKSNHYVRPKFSSYSECIIKEGRHPIIEEYSKEEFIPNDLELYNDNLILLITGPNMAGKSTYMRQNAIISIMAQMGSFVPAKEVTLPIYDQIFTRIGSSDDITNGESTFMMEMLEVNNALSSATRNSLLIFDEVGRGTATFDGMALAQSILEYIHNHLGSKTFFSTHYHELTSLDKSLNGIKNVHVDATINEELNVVDQIIFHHKVLPGAAFKSYGVNVASLAHIPQLVTDRAKDILEKLESKSKYDENLLSIKNYVKPTIKEVVPDYYLKLAEKINSIDVDTLTPIQALLLLKDLKEIK